MVFFAHVVATSAITEAEMHLMTTALALSQLARLYLPVTIMGIPEMTGGVVSILADIPAAEEETGKIRPFSSPPISTPKLELRPG